MKFNFALVDNDYVIRAKTDLALNGEEKKKVLIKFLDDRIELPWLAESLDNKLIGMVIDNVVEYYNEFIGNDWKELIDDYKYGNGAKGCLCDECKENS